MRVKKYVLYRRKIRENNNRVKKVQLRLLTRIGSDRSGNEKLNSVSVIRCLFGIIFVTFFGSSFLGAYATPSKSDSTFEFSHKSGNSFHSELQLYRLTSSRFSYNLSISDMEILYLKRAQDETKKGNWNEVKTLLEGLHSDESKILYIQSLYELNLYQELISYIDNLSHNNKIRLLGEIIEKYILASIYLSKYDEIEEILVLQKKYYPDPIHNIYKQIIYSLILAHNFEPVIELTDIFPSNIYQLGEKNYILGVVYYHLGMFNFAKSFFENINTESPFKRLSHNYLSLIYYHTKDTESIPQDVGGLSDEVKFNYALNYLRAGKKDEAGSFALKIEHSEKTNIIDLFIAWRMKYYLTALSLFESFPYFNPLEYSLTTLIMAESLYHTGRYRDAEEMFKLYNTFDNADEKYANHALGYSFKGFYRYNSTAYYWIKNLTDEKTFYDSLAAYNLSLLYTQTENYPSARNYFRYYRRKYGLPEGDSIFFTAYLQTLQAQEDWVFFIDLVDRYGEALSADERRSRFISIADYYLKKQKIEEAVNYYNKALEIEFDDDLVLKVERLRFNLGLYKDSEDFILALIEKYPASSFKMKLSLDLTKFYLNQKRYAVLETFVDSLLYGQQQTETLSVSDNSVYADSLLYFKGYAFKESGRMMDAAQLFLNLYRETSSDNLQALIILRLNILFTKMDAKIVIGLLNGLLEDENSYRKDYFLLLAAVYERISLFREANNIYSLMLDDEPENVSFYYNMAVNEMRQRNYSRTLEHLEMIKELEINEDALFLTYLAYYSLDRKKDAIRTLLTLYNEYPESSKRFEIIKNLIELFTDNEDYLFAWYFLKEYYPIASRSEQWALDQYRNRLAQVLAEDTLTVMNDIDFQALYADTLTVNKEEVNTDDND